jgi:exopolyphosphatase/pppGpp-phosphohydrolase
MPPRMRVPKKMSEQVMNLLVADHEQSEQQQIRNAVRTAEEQGKTDYYLYGYNSWYHINNGQIMGQGKNGPLLDNRSKQLSNQPNDPGAQAWKVFEA